MGASVAEERVRAALVAEWRAVFPDARIIHELALDEGRVRLDLGAVLPLDRIILAEIKSERDTLKRFAAQITQALQVASQVWVVVAERHVKRLRLYLDPDKLAGCHLRIEDGAGRLLPGSGRVLGRLTDPFKPPVPNPAAMLAILTLPELAHLLRTHVGPPRVSDRRDTLKTAAVENMTGAEIRSAVCEALRRRHFARADDAHGVRHDDTEIRGGGGALPPAPRAEANQLNLEGASHGR